MYRSIVIPVDGSALAEQAIPAAAALARRDNAAVHFVVVHEPQLLPIVTVDLVDEQLRQQQRAYVDRLAADMMARFGLHASAEVREGVVPDAICEEVRTARGDLVVMTTHGRTGFSRLWLGSVADSVMRHATTPVLMVRANPEQVGTIGAARAPFHRVLVPLDGSPLAGEILEQAFRLGGDKDCAYTLVHVVEPVPLASFALPEAAPMVLVPDEAATAELVRATEAEMQAVAKSVRREHPAADVDVVVRRAANAAEGLLAIAAERQADVITIATHGRGLSRLVMGSVADKVLRGSSGAVLIYRPAHD